MNQVNANHSIKRIRDNNVHSYSYDILRPIDLFTEVSLTREEEQRVLCYRGEIQDIYDGKNPRMIVIAGPCSVHSYEGIIRYAERLKKTADSVSDQVFVVLRAYLEKPRTHADWPGFIFDPDLVYYIDPKNCDHNKGLILSRRLLKEITDLGLPVATELVDFDNPQYIGDFISWAAIGARTCESQPHKQMASALSMPIGFKNNTAGEIISAVDGVITARTPGQKFRGIDMNGARCYVIGNGNLYSSIVLRGGNGAPNYLPQYIEEAERLLRKAKLEERIMVDCSHGNCIEIQDGKRVKVAMNQLLGGESLRQQKLDGNKSIFGVMYESNLAGGKRQDFPKRLDELGKIDPDRTLTDEGIPIEVMEEEICKWREVMKRIIG